MDRLSEEVLGAEDKPDEDHDFQRTKDAWFALLDYREGRRVIYDLLNVCHYGLSPFTGNNDMTNMIAGKQKIGEYIMEMVNSLSPESYHLMLKEAQEDRSDDNK